MKFFIKCVLSIFLMTLIQSASAKLALAPVVITFKAQNQFVDSVLKILTTQFAIPAPLIELRAQPNGCHKVSRALLQICILENEELQLINWNKEKWEMDYGEFGNFAQIKTELNNLPLTASDSQSKEFLPNEREQ